MNTYQAYQSPAANESANSGNASGGNTAYPHQDREFSSAGQPTHPALIGYLFWVIGFTGAHRFYFGKPITGAIWFFTGGLFLVGWIIDLFLIPSMEAEAESRYRPNEVDYSVAWVLLIFLGIFGVHRFYMGKWMTGLLYLVTGGLFGIGYAYDICTLNEQIDEM
ncbi:TM2 domain-containing membrane protein YozV [Neorhodopirellula lusitana]|uniref:TM2 domain-containing membrane protein YozV n=1 Tax=Neorhodopirellula lusitana TaxID=445327 RepID=A0ABY1PUC7_9BACT|nr:TM2 domain-containing protein [Neorhodopirellula lusitana]SMP46296.1 TM2 domain-containing membrane protein YozV [Neorhodopirellula lusitana]